MDQATGHDHHFEPRVEDAALVQGLGRFVEDAPQENQAYAAFVRSPYAHARIRSIDTQATRAAPGVVAVLTHAELDAAGIGSASVHPPMVGRNGAKLIVPFRPVLARDRVMHAGQPVALVVADSLAQAHDAAEMVVVDYEELPSVADLRAALADGAPQLFPEAPGNIALDWPGPVADDGSNAREIEAIFSAAAYKARVSVVNQRLIVNTMEPRGATARYDAATDSYTLRSCSQGAGPQRDQLAAVTGFPREKLRVITEDVGGAFGVKTAAYPEYPCLLVAAKLTGRPVAWMATRSESFLSDQHARDTVTEAELAIDAKGKFLALRVKHLAAMGGYIGVPGAHIQTNNFSRCFPGMYAIARVQVDVQCVFTNTVPTGSLSRRRAAGSELRAGASRGGGRARHRHRSGAAAPAQPDRAQADPLQDRHRHHLRLRRFRADPRQGAGACALRRVQETPPRVIPARQAARHRHLVFPRACGRAADRERVAAVRGRQARPRHRRAEHRPGPPHDLPAPDRREARHPGRADRASARRHRTWT